MEKPSTPRIVIALAGITLKSLILLVPRFFCVARHECSPQRLCQTSSLNISAERTERPQIDGAPDCTLSTVTTWHSCLKT
ncbi:hypothetical protein CONLIGDRAFT_142593 [Coniochaeta ligniaria NRRL 30616]|uniref:Uncharacterized protein n=1 Tax=Coniochaeta ligniaria NRRL 30616 TaxID=1408157 RepID=A0A1J7J6F3_9PEZI|nr:hypothetical protein CONLIGDRAFT_142593 [Coniochaeta ligniaria NRRL 30616]